MNAQTFAALGEPSRLRIVETLRESEYAVGDLAERLNIRQPQVSKHLRVLRDAGIVVVEPVARHRINHLRLEPFEEIDQWIESFERLWEKRLDQLGTYLTRTERDSR